MMETLLDVREMSCGACVKHVTHALTEVAGVARVDVDLATGRVVVAHESAKLDEMLKALDAAGYPATLLAS